jgi:hypothetical protein
MNSPVDRHRPLPELMVVLGALILLCQCGEVFDEDGVEASGYVTLEAADDFAV